MTKQKINYKVPLEVLQYIDYQFKHNGVAITGFDRSKLFYAIEEQKRIVKLLSKIEKELSHEQARTS